METSKLPPIPINTEYPDVRGYHKIDIDNNSSYLREPLTDILAHGIAGIAYYHIEDGQNPPYCTRISGSLPSLWCRESLITRLKKANQLLKTFDFELYVLDAYRPVSTQEGLWEFFKTKNKKKHPDLNEQELDTITSQFASDPRYFNVDNMETWPTHTSGASIDLTLRSRITKTMPEMGADFDHNGDEAHTAFFEIPSNRMNNPHCDEALINRRLLHWAMTSVGFVNYPYEYWHYDYGNQLYQFNRSVMTKELPSKAWYGYIGPPSVKL